MGVLRHAPATLPSGNRRGIHCIGGWVGPRIGMDWCGKSHSHRDSIPGRPARRKSLYLPLIHSYVCNLYNYFLCVSMTYVFVALYVSF